jgi:hypothetical protein
MPEGLRLATRCEMYVVRVEAVGRVDEVEDIGFDSFLR